MDKAPQTNVVGTFHEPEQAEAAVRALRQDGFAESRVAVSDLPAAPADAAVTKTEDGAGLGSLAGAGVGVVVGLGVVTGILPVAGAIAASGAVVVGLAAAGGSLAGAALGAIAATGTPSAGQDTSGAVGPAPARTLVTVAADGRSSQAEETLRRCGSHDTQHVAR